MSKTTGSAPAPSAIVVHAKSRVLGLTYADGREFRLPFEYLRVYSPSAEVRGHGPGQEVLQVGKRDVELISVDPVGHYAIQPMFNDGHSTGIYSWDYLYWLGDQQEQLWAEYLRRLEQAGAHREPHEATSASTAFTSVDFKKG